MKRILVKIFRNSVAWFVNATTLTKVMVILVAVTVIVITFSCLALNKTNFKLYLPEVGLWVHWNLDVDNPRYPLIEVGRSRWQYVTIPTASGHNKYEIMRGRVNVINPFPTVDSTFCATHPYNTATELEKIGLGIILYSPKMTTIYIPYGVSWGVRRKSMVKK